MANISKVDVGRRGEEYSLSWVYGGDDYHVWLRSGTHELMAGIGTNGRELYKTVHSTDKPGHRDVRYLDAKIPKNKAMIDEAMASAVAEHMFEDADAKVAEGEAKRLAKAAAEYKVTLAKKAGPKMLVILKAISEFWKEGGDIHPLSPGALILEGEETIADAVRAAILEAETGGAVAL
jgi:hypothetical protein